MTLCQAMPIRQAAQLLRVGDMRRLRTLDRGIAVGRAKEDLSSVAAVGLDETAARRGPRYISPFHALGAGRPRFAWERRKADVLAQFADDLDARRQEAKSTPSLKYSRYLWLKDKSVWTGRAVGQFTNLRAFDLKPHRALRIRESRSESYPRTPRREEAKPSNDHVAKTLQAPRGGHPQHLRLSTHHRPVERGKSLTHAVTARGYGTVNERITIAYPVAGKHNHLPPSLQHHAVCDAVFLLQWAQTAYPP